MPIINGKYIIPALPDVILIQIFNQLPYKDICNAEAVCRRWQNLIHQKFRKEVHELVVEQMGCHRIEATQNVAMERLTISCRFDSPEFLAGIMRRHHGWLKRLTCDVRFLATVGSLNLKKDERKKFFTCSDKLWIIMLTCSDELLQEFASIEEMLFLDLKHVTLQIHLLNEPVQNAAKVLKLLRNRYPGLTVAVELHAEYSKLITRQLECLEEGHLSSLKIICTALEQTPLQLDEISLACESSKITYDWLGFRDWVIATNPNVPIAKHHFDTFRISSCTLADVDKFIQTIQRNQRQPHCKRIELPEVIVKDKENKNDPKQVKPKKEFNQVMGFKLKKVAKKNLYKDQNADGEEDVPHVIPLRRLEVAGHCVFTNFSFLNKKAQQEFEYRVVSRVDDLDLDISNLYFVF